MSGESLVRVREPSLPFALLTPVDSKPNTDIVITHHSNVSTWLPWFNSVRQSDVIALDIETRGTNPTEVDSTIVGIGFSHGRSSLYIDVAGISGMRLLGLVDTINKLPAVIAHNIYFDASFLRYHWQCEPKWVACTLGLYKQLATEGFPNQRWGLKSAQTQLLGWTETNEILLDEWLISNGYIKGSYSSYSVSPEDTTEDRLHKLHRITEVQSDPEKSPNLRPNKAEMWRAPTDILGYYCALDCDSTWQLYTKVLAPAASRFPDLQSYHSVQFLPLVDILIDQKLHGIRINVERLREHADSLRVRMEEVKEDLRHHTIAGKLIREFEAERYREFLDKEPTKYKKGKILSAEPPRWKAMRDPGTEPNKYTKSGALSKNWAKWSERKERYDQCEGRVERLDWINWCERRDSGEYGKLELSKNWINWDTRRQEILAGDHPKKYGFNLGSGTQLQWLLYEKLMDWMDGEEPRGNRAGSIFLLTPDGRKVELDRTKSGGLPTDAKALSQMGEVGSILLRYNDAAKELSYVESYIELSQDHDDEGYGILRPSFSVPGTVTGRLSGRDPNIQQIPKTRATLECFVPRKGFKFVQCDHSALENVVLAELSGDPKLMGLYGPGAEPHDSYLYNAAEMYKVSGVEVFREIAAAYVPTPEVVSRLKKEYKGVRAISKKTTLSKNYGIGVDKLYKDLLLQGAAVTRHDVQRIHEAYDDVYSGVSEWNEQLQEEWRVRGGWVLNGIGRPLGVWERTRKDLVNRVCQSTGHDIHMEYVRIIRILLDESGIEWYPIIMDLHDESIVEVREDQVDRAKYLMETVAYNILNSEYLQGDIPLSGGGEIADSLAEIKIED